MDVPAEVPDGLAVAVAVDAPAVKLPAVTVTGCKFTEFVGYTLSPCASRKPVVPAEEKLAAWSEFMQVAGLVVPSYWQSQVKVVPYSVALTTTVVGLAVTVSESTRLQMSVKFLGEETVVVGQESRYVVAFVCCEGG